MLKLELKKQFEPATWRPLKAAMCAEDVNGSLKLTFFVFFSPLIRFQPHAVIYYWRWKELNILVTFGSSFYRPHTMNNGSVILSAAWIWLHCTISNTSFTRAKHVFFTTSFSFLNNLSSCFVSFLKLQYIYIEWAAPVCQVPIRFLKEGRLAPGLSH